MTDMEKSYTNLKKIAEKNGEIEFEAEVPVAILDEYIKEELARAAADFSWPGFRKGKVPKNIVREHMNEMAILDAAADEALHDVIPEIAADEKLSVLGRPQLTITKIAPKNPLGFKIRFALSPAVALPDYKKIAGAITARATKIEVEEKEVDAAIERIRKMIPVTGPSKDIATPSELTDDFVKQLGPFENVAAFRTEMKKRITEEKELELTEAKRDEMVREIVKQSKVTVPQMLVEQEIEDWKDNRDAELERAGLTLEKYLEQVKKTADELERGARAEIEEQMRTSFVLREIRREEKIEADEKEIRENIAHLKRRYPNENEGSLAGAAQAIAIQKKMFEILEGKAENKKVPA
jgi:FKBP-type peptidyl-prolyl cis-trans isomerase (trigger factor)